MELSPKTKIKPQIAQRAQILKSLRKRIRILIGRFLNL